jgi:hypothetical protein
MNPILAKLLAAGRSVAAFRVREAGLVLTATAFLTLLVLVLHGLGMMGSGGPP